ncbi:GNAT family N-acetyltransferase [Kitasatospora sp. NPDC048296]|uniref:GNAT family N-acetyltransferase n=1 Tax=Kitasatospora sp. NPDC048296 TaxID=3364048 RepID=UPI00371D9DBE
MEENSAASRLRSKEPIPPGAEAPGLPRQNQVNLRELTANDTHAIRRIYSGASVRHLGRTTMEDAEAHRYVEQAVCWAQERPRIHHILGIDVEGDLVGIVKLNTAAAQAGLSYILREDTWSHGYATAAVIGVLTLAFDTLYLDSVAAKHRTANPASGRVLAKAGFAHINETEGFAYYTVRRRGSSTAP